MARTFSTLFSYNGKAYTAVISQHDGTVNIYIPDESLHHILPGGKASYKTAEGPEIDKLHVSAAQKIILGVLSSINEQGVGGLTSAKSV